MFKGRHSRKSGNPLKYDKLKFLDFLLHPPRVDARLRGHDELRHSLSEGEGEEEQP